MEPSPHLEAAGSSTSPSQQPDWDPLDPEVWRDPLGTMNRMRRTCPEAYSHRLGWCVFRHADILRIPADPHTFSNAVSRHLSVPNGTDPPEHLGYRRIVEPRFSREHLARFEPHCRRWAARLARPLVKLRRAEFMTDAALPCAAHTQCAFLNWPSPCNRHLVRWTLGHQQAVRAAPEHIPAAIEEILRLFGPLRYNRRITTRRVILSGRTLEAGARITLMWPAANRDEEVFEDPCQFRLDRDQRSKPPVCRRRPCLPRCASGAPRAARVSGRTADAFRADPPGRPMACTIRDLPDQRVLRFTGAHPSSLPPLGPGRSTRRSHPGRHRSG